MVRGRSINRTTSVTFSDLRIYYSSGHLFTGVSKETRTETSNRHSASPRRGDEAEREKVRGWGTENDFRRLRRISKLESTGCSDGSQRSGFGNLRRDRWLPKYVSGLKRRFWILVRRVKCAIVDLCLHKTIVRHMNQVKGRRIVTSNGLGITSSRRCKEIR